MRGRHSEVEKVDLDIYSRKGWQLPQKRLYLSPELAFQFEKSDGVALRIFGVYIKPVIGHGKLGDRVVDFVFLDLWWTCGFGWWSGFLIPKSQMLKNLFYDILILDNADYLHRSGTFWASQRVHFIDFLEQSCPVFSRLFWWLLRFKDIGYRLILVLFFRLPRDTLL